MADQAETQTNNTEQQAGGNQQDGGQPQGTEQQAGGGQPENGGQQDSGQNQEGEPQGGGQQGESGKGDPRIALRQERAKRKRLEQELSRVRGESGTSTEEGGEGGSNEDLPDFSISEEEQDDPNALSQKLKAIHQDAVTRATERVRSEMAASQDVQSEAQSILDEFDVFNQDGPVGEYATRAAADAIGELPAGSSMEDIRSVARGVAQDFDALRAGSSGGGSSSEEGGGNEGPLAVGAGSAESAHLHPEAAPQDSLKEAGRMAKQAAARQVQRQR